MHETHSTGGLTRTSVITSVTAVLAFIISPTIKSDVAWIIGCVSGCIAMLSGAMAIRYYWHATKKVKRENNN